MSATRIRAILRKELRDYRRNRSIVVAMAIVSVFFTIEPGIAVFAVPASEASTLATKEPLIYLLGIPAVVPAAVAAYSVAGERQQGTLEPLLTTPVRADELLVGKALAVFAPTVALAYGVMAAFAAAVELFADPAIASAVLRAPVVVAIAIFTPLVAGWAIWVAIAISARVSDVRVAQQLSILSGLLLVTVAALVSVGVIHATHALTLGLGAALALADALGWRIVSATFDRERLITWTRP